MLPHLTNQQKMNTRKTNTLLIPINMRRVGGRYVPTRGTIRTAAQPRVPSANRSAQLAQENASLKEENMALETELQMLKGMLTASKDAFEVPSTTYQLGLQERATLKERLAHYESNIESQKQIIQALSSQWDAGACRLREESNRFRKVEAELEMAKSRLSEVKHQLEQATTSRVIILPAPKPFMNGVQSTNFDQNLNKALRNENQGLQHQIMESQATNQTLQRQVRRLNSKHPIGSMRSRNS
uniref:AlNc14C410G11454 protein n=1 Tax=Albugo laibachii Nc14 TaxID=890382 RepID=F0WEZ7_9STRA|nr:AlNc14C78G5195 [Albugo laibachii Nc14]CCA26761.1 AlNc14C410G11454 [Albugo laibachii Nc14]|eukprot:CCA26761.1 AlNc14C410G11454 [Albugo laibachii Nc14]